MVRRNKCKPRLIPQQDRRICGSICFCQLIVVFSCVSLIYLTVAIYIPSYKAFNSGFEERPVMCQTINTSMLNNCSWASCGEWCLTKTSGFCPQMHVTTRQNGTNLQLHNCSRYTSVECPPPNFSNLTRLNCNIANNCDALNGLYNCSLGHCANISKIFLCHYKADGFVVDSDKDNMKLNGFFECNKSRCVKVKRAFSCDRICEGIDTPENNVYITLDNTVYMATCEEAVAYTITNGDEPGRSVLPTSIWKSAPGEVLMMSCHTITKEGAVINGTDCINGTIYNYTDIPQPEMNFTTFWSLANKWRRLLDLEQKFVPMQSVLTIYNNSRVYINLDGCVNTLKGECVTFLQTHGRDGANQTAQSRFPCFYKKNSSELIIARYDLAKTWRELIISISVPSVLFVVSFVTLCIITQSVRVGDDTKMRCKYCIGTLESETSDITTTNSKYEFSSSSCNASKKDDTPLVRS